MSRLRSHAGWVVPTLGVAILFGILVGYPLVWLGYALFNILGVWLYCDSRGSQKQTRQTWMKALAIAMLPVGAIGLIATGNRGHTPTEKVSFGSDDETTRKETARAASRGGSALGSFRG